MKKEQNEKSKGSKYFFLRYGSKMEVKTQNVIFIFWGGDFKILHFDFIPLAFDFLLQCSFT